MFRNLFSLFSLTAAGAALSLFAIGSTAGASGQTPPPDDGTTRPESPAAYAQAAFDAWIHGDATRIINLSTPAAAQRLLATEPEPDAWTGPPLCEGAAGSTYCTWASETSQLALRVANEAASTGQAHALTEAAFIPPVDGIAIWPFSTQEAADNTQQSVDEGHSPWMLDPNVVASSYANAEHGWEEPVVEKIGPSIYRVADTATGVVLDLEIAQPVRQGKGGIWAVIRTLMPVTPEPTAPEGPGRTWDESAVWQPSTVEFAVWEATCGASPAMMDEAEGIQCGLKVMGQTGALPAAQDFLVQNGYFLESFQDLGLVDYGRGSAPWINMCRPTQQLFLNGASPIVEAPFTALESWSQDSSYAEIAVADEFASPWTEYGVLLASQGNPQPGVAQAIEMAFPLKPCRACAPLGFAGVRYTFDGTGLLSSETLLSFDESQPQLRRMALAAGVQKVSGQLQSDSLRAGSQILLRRCALRLRRRTTLADDTRCTGEPQRSRNRIADAP